MSEKNFNLKALGSKETTYHKKYNVDVLEYFENKFPGYEYEVEFVCPEFTALCPKTGQPDFAKIIITYSPNDKLVESKSLKLYLFSFRETGSFHEDCVNTIARDLNNLLNPKWLKVQGFFYPRGGIAINPTCFFKKDEKK